MWNAQIVTHEANSYIIKNQGYNQDIAPDSSVNIGFQANWNDNIKTPKSYDLLIAKQEVGDTDYTIDFKVTGDWGQAFTGEISITNNTEETIEDWTLEFDFDKNIERFWTAEIVEHEGEHYVIKNAGYNANIAPGQTITLGFSGNPGNVDSKPTNYILNQLGQEIDYEKDTDGDGLPDWFEKELGTDPNKADTDGDDLLDGYEYFELDTDFLKIDTDGNGILDGDEDLDEDKLTNIEEFNLKTNPINKDTDGDRLLDGDEVKKFFTNPLVYDEIDMTIDSDEDGLFDGLERILGTNESDPDTDSDGLSDYHEYFVQRTNSLEVDTDENGLSDAEEDSDKDGLNNLEEYINKTNPFEADTDCDGLSDYDEVNIYKTNPTLEDTDGDTLLDGDEIKIGLDPLNQYTFTDIHDSKYIINQLIQPSEIPEINTEDNVYELSINVAGCGNIKDNLVATESIATNMVKDNRAIVGKVAQLNYDKSIEKATLYFKMDESKSVNESTLFPNEEEFKGIKRYQIFRYDYEMNLLYPIYTKHDIENNVIYSEVTQLGDYCIIDMEKWLYDIGLISPINNRARMSFNDFDEPIEKEEISNDTYQNYEGISIEELEKLIQPEIKAFNRTKISTLNKQADVVFVVDSTGSMGGVISSVKTNISNIIAYLRDKNITLHVSFVEYKDITDDGINSTKVHSLNGSNWLYSTQDMINVLGSIRADGGGDWYYVKKKYNLN